MIEWELFPMALGPTIMPLQVMKQTAGQSGRGFGSETLFFNYRQDKVDEFNRTLKDYTRAQFTAEPPGDLNLSKVDYEAWFDHFEPFYWALYLDLTAFTLVVLSWFGKARLLNRTAFWVLVLTFAVQHPGVWSRGFIFPVGRQ